MYGVIYAQAHHTVHVFLHSLCIPAMHTYPGTYVHTYIHVRVCILRRNIDLMNMYMFESEDLMCTVPCTYFKSYPFPWPVSALNPFTFLSFLFPFFLLFFSPFSIPPESKDCNELLTLISNSITRSWYNLNGSSS